MSDKKNDPNEKGRYWAGLIYPGDSAPDNWQELMQLSGLQILVSPLHDQDIADVKTGELKKPHRHVVAMWMNTTTHRNAQRFFEQFNGPKTIIRLESPRGMARYLIHLDNPEKAQYSPDDVLAFNGADWQKIAIPDRRQAGGHVHCEPRRRKRTFEAITTCSSSANRSTPTCWTMPPGKRCSVAK